MTRLVFDWYSANAGAIAVIFGMISSRSADASSPAMTSYDWVPI
jgi:hypothetical protein